MKVMKKMYTRNDFEIVPHESYNTMWTSNDRMFIVGEKDRCFKLFKAKNNKGGTFFKWVADFETEEALLSYISN